MGKINYIKGDLLENPSHFDGISHGCNCFHSFGAGVARYVRDKFIDAWKADLDTKKGDRTKLGTYSFFEYPDFTIFNLYTQYKYTRHEVDVDYSAVESVFSRLNENQKGKHIAIPLIGAGLADGDWDRISNIIEKNTPDLQITAFILPQDKQFHYLLKD